MASACSVTGKVEAMSKYKIEIKNLYKIFGPNDKDMVELVANGTGKQELLDKHGHVLGLKNVNIGILANSVNVIMGLSGSGKSTLIRHINRLIEPTVGEIIVDGENVLGMDHEKIRDFRRFGASMVFQKFGLMPHRTVIENAMYGLNIQGIASVEAEKRAKHWLNRVGLSGFEDRFPAQLSGGMQQRVGLARALATDADILLMDEAFSALDPLIRADMQTILLDLQAELHKTIVFITHDLDEALRIGDDIAILRDGELIQKGTPQNIVLKPADDYVADFTKDVNRARVLTLNTLSHDTGSKEGLRLDGDLSIEQAMQQMVNSEYNLVTVMNDSTPIGQVSLSDMVGAISRPDATNSGSTTTYR
jgi:glycine betaine/proline transport system ATP-binding protein